MMELTSVQVLGIACLIMSFWIAGLNIYLLRLSKLIPKGESE